MFIPSAAMRVSGSKIGWDVRPRICIVPAAATSVPYLLENRTFTDGSVF